MLKNARSYAGTATFSDHRLLKTTMQIDSFRLFKRAKLVVPKRINVAAFRDSDIKQNYQNRLRVELTNVQANDETNAQEQWDTVSRSINVVAEEVIGFEKRTKQYKRDHDPAIQELAEKQKNIRMQISDCNDAGKICSLRTARNQILKEIKRKITANRAPL